MTHLQHLTKSKFADYSLHPDLLSGINDAGFEFCTPIQAQSLPISLQGKDIAGQAQTGTGKTVAFLLACCQYMILNGRQNKQDNQPRAIILAPTRELAIQIFKDAEILAAHTGFRLGLVYGGTGYDSQRQMLSSGVDILIGTPGRIIDYFKQKIFSLKSIQVVVLDEADRMFDLGFIKDIRYLLRRMPPADQRLNLLFSATLSYRVIELAYEHMNNPQTVKIEADSKVADLVDESAYYPAENEKLPLLVNLLKKAEQNRTLVFVNTKHTAEKISRVLRANDINNGVLSGDVPQNKRERLLQKFKDGELMALVATDVAARGLHIPDVTHVCNFDLPQDAQDYVHRIGRTARAGASGHAISFICERYAYSIMEIEDYIGHAIPRHSIKPEDLLPINLPENKSKKKSRSRDNTRKQTISKKESKAEQNQKPDTVKYSEKPADNQGKTSKPHSRMSDDSSQISDRTSRPTISQASSHNSRQAAQKENPEKMDYRKNHLNDKTKRFSKRFGEVPLVG